MPSFLSHLPNGVDETEAAATEDIQLIPSLICHVVEGAKPLFCDVAN